MALKIEDHRAEALARELAALTGETIAQAVRRALEQRLERERRGQDAEGRLARVNALLARLDQETTDRPTSHHSWLFDEDGLPK